MEEAYKNIDSVQNGDLPHPKKKFWKFWIVFSFFMLGFGAIILRLFFIQVVDADNYREKAMRQHRSRVNLSAQRGDIYDRNGILLATTFESISIAADPTILIKDKDRKEVCARLEKITGIPRSSMLKKIKEARGEFVWLARGLKPIYSDQIDKITHRGIIKLYEPKRKYLYGDVCSHIIGRTDIDNAGIEGIEKKWDGVLKGTGGFKIMHRDAMGRLLPAAELPGSPPIHGKSLQLTIDIALQRIVVHELREGIERTGAVSGVVIAMKPSTGEILAMASYPDYNPNNPQFGKMAEGAMRNRGITDTYEPGSTFKLITASTALEEHIVTTGDTLDGRNGYAQFKGYSIRDVHAMGRIPFREAFEESSNIIFSEVGNSIPSDKFFKYVRDFGFGIILGIDLPGEVSGSMKRANQFTENYKRYLGHGYGISVTPLQMVNAYSTVANGGVMMKPYVVKEIINEKGLVETKFKPEKIRKVISEETSDTMKSLCLGVVERGTGKNVKIDGVDIAGKTGTAQQFRGGTYSNSFYTASFAGFFPVKNPKIAMYVLLDRPKGAYYGGSTAGPIFRNIVRSWINVSPDIVLDMDDEDSTFLSLGNRVIVPEITGLFVRDAKKMLESYKLKLKAPPFSNGIIVTQEPRAGTDTTIDAVINAKVLKSYDIIDTTESAGSGRVPEVKGMTLRRALAVLHSSGYSVNVKGSGIVKRQYITKHKSGVVTVHIECD